MIASYPTGGTKEPPKPLERPSGTVPPDNNPPNNNNNGGGGNPKNYEEIDCPPGVGFDNANYWHYYKLGDRGYAEVYVYKSGNNVYAGMETWAGFSSSYTIAPETIGAFMDSSSTESHDIYNIVKKTANSTSYNGIREAFDCFENYTGVSFTNYDSLIIDAIFAVMEEHQLDEITSELEDKNSVGGRLYIAFSPKVYREYGTIILYPGKASEMELGKYYNEYSYKRVGIYTYVNDNLVFLYDFNDAIYQQDGKSETDINIIKEVLNSYFNDVFRSAFGDPKNNRGFSNDFNYSYKRKYNVGLSNVNSYTMSGGIGIVPMR